ncbi:MAG: hypothetical protein MJ175_00565 [Clostridia bacterium]|nr:hypothetical protein [Clostridia bacterium]
MNRKISKSTVLALLTSILLCTAASCGEAAETPAGNTPDAPDVTAAQTEETVDTKDVINWESANLPVKDFGGDVFSIASYELSSMTHAWYLLAPEESTGEVLNDAIFNRNQKISDLYNISFAVEYSTTPETSISKSVTAGDDAYDLGLVYLSKILPLAQDGKVLNWYDVPNVDLTKQWWDQAVIEQLSYHDTIFAMSGDISPAANTRTFVFVFNKQLCRSLDLELPYQSVLDGKWTVDKLKEYIANVNYDVNGDGVMDYEDRWGYFSEDGASYMMFAAGGGSVVSLDKNGDYELTYNNERNITVAEKALSIIIDKTTTLKANNLVNANGGQWTVASQWFAGGGALMRSTSLEPIPRDYRAMEADFGILPFPKMDESQADYCAMADNVSARMLCIPATAKADYVGLITESLAAESVSTVSPAFYDVCLNGKTVRDDESSAMLDIIFATKHFDIGLALDIGGFRSQLTNLESKNSTDVASAFAKMEKNAQKQLEKYVTKINELG